jgi:hypothetical protein
MPNTPTSNPHNLPNVLTIRISGKAMSTIEGSELNYDPVKYDGGSQGARDAHAALAAARGRRQGKGWTYELDVTPAGADILEDYCRTVGVTFADETEAETRADGRALLVVADRINAQLADLFGTCQWFALCDRYATGTTPHPTLGEVPTCDRHHAFATANR